MEFWCAVLYVLVGAYVGGAVTRWVYRRALAEAPTMDDPELRICSAALGIAAGFLWPLVVLLVVMTHLVVPQDKWGNRG